MTKKNDELVSPLEALRQRVIQRVEALEDAPFLRSIEALVEAYTTEPEEQPEGTDDLEENIGYDIDGNPISMSDFERQAITDIEDVNNGGGASAKDVIKEKIEWLESLK